MFCPKCGSKISDNARFCTECGLPLGKLSGSDNKKPSKAEGTEHASSTESAETLPTEPNSAESVRTEGESALSPVKSEQEPETAETEGSASQDSNASAELASQEAPSPEPHAAPAPAAEPAGSSHSQMFNFFMQKRQIGSRLVPQFAIMIAAFIAAAGIAYAAVMVYKNVIEPNLQQQPTQQEQPAEEPEKAEKKEDQTKQVNEAAHVAYQDVLEQYREALTNGDYDDYADDETSQSDTVSKYFTDQEANSKYPLVSRDAASSIGMYENGISADGSMYVFIDLNDDGVDELVLGAATEWSEDNYIIAVYAYIGGQVKGVCKSWYRNSYFLRQGKVLINDCPSGMFAHVATVKKYKAEAEFETLDRVDMFSDDRDKTITTIRTKNGQEVSRVTDSADSDNRESVTIFSELYADYPVDTSIAWQPLN